MYYFAAKTIGDGGLVSDMSNVVNVTTGIQPGAVEEVFASNLTELQNYINNVRDSRQSGLDPSIFADAGNGDFHLAETATTAIGKGLNLWDDVPFDFDGANRPKTGNFDIGAYQTAFDETPELDGKLISVSLEKQVYIGTPVKITTGQVFSFTVVMENTGIETWGQFLDSGERGASFLSRNPDYNDTFGTFFISPNQGSLVEPGESFTYDTYLRAPSEPGEYTMTCNWPTG